ncbi:MAG: ABC transporter ATP-binding protein [Planctomycetota bacterium]
MKNPIVVTEQLTKSFGNFTALRQCSLSVYEGEVFGLLGPNGAGKSTLLRLILGFLNPTSGSSRVNGFCSQNNRVDAHSQISYLPGDARLYRLVKAKQLLTMFCGFRPDASFEKAKRICERLELNLNTWVGLMSTGMRQKLSLAICLCNEAPLIILDEPTANLDPTVRGQVLQMVREIRQQGRTVIFSSHVLSEIEETCDRVAILRKGELVYLDSISKLNQHHRILANLVGELPELPEHLKSVVTIKKEGDKIQLETPSDLGGVLKWLADAPFSDVMIQPVGLRSVYDKYHHPETIVSQTEADPR